MCFADVGETGAAGTHNRGCEDHALLNAVHRRGGSKPDSGDDTRSRPELQNHDDSCFDDSCEGFGHRFAEGIEAVLGWSTLWAQDRTWDFAEEMPSYGELQDDHAGWKHWQNADRRQVGC